MRASTPGLIAIAFAGTSCGPLKIVFPEDCTAGGCDTSASAAQAPASCSDLDAPTALNTWEVSTVEDVS